MSTVAACSKEVVPSTPLVISNLRPPLTSFRSTNFIDSVDLPHFSTYANSRVPIADTDNRNPYVIDRSSSQCVSLSAPRALQSAAPNSTSDSATSATSSSSYSSMSYSVTAPTNFGSCQYLAHEHPNELKSTYSSETRSIADYMRADFNPIIDSLNFVSNSSSYDTLSGDGFSAWSVDVMDAETDMKTRVEFGDSGCGKSDTCPSLACQPEDYTNADRLYSFNNRRITSTDRFNLLTPQRDSTSACLPTFENGSYPTINGRNYDPKLLFNGPTGVSLATNINSATQLTVEPNPELLGHLRPTGANSSKPVQISGDSGNECSLSNPVMMTPDSSTTGFLSHKFATSSDDGEISPTPTTNSSQPRTPGRIRKAAPTLATGRRNLKGEPVDPDEADRRMKRRERNRKSAQKCRERKVQRTQELQAQVDGLQLQINRLTHERDALRTEARQFVALLHLHCPGVAIPYMSCLSETAEQISVRGDSSNSHLTVTSPLKSDTSGHGDISNGWRVRNPRKTVSSVEALNTNSKDDPFSHLPTMVSMRSHVIPARSKPSLFNFPPEQVDVAVDEPIMHLSSPSNIPKPEQVHRNDGRPITGSASTSSSSPSSGYELSFPVSDIPLNNVVLTIHPEDNEANASNLARDQSHIVLSSPSCTPVFQSPSTTNLLSSATNPVLVKNDEWDHYLSLKSINSRKLQQMSPSTSSSHPIVYSGSGNMSNAGRCDVRHTEPSSTRSSRPIEGACFS